MLSNRVSFVNGEFVNHNNAFVHIEDRGFQFADAIYEVILFYKNQLIDAKNHLERMFAGLDSIGIKHTFIKQNLIDISLELFARNNLESGSVYLQVTRGRSERIQILPPNLEPTIIATVSTLKKITDEELEKGLSLITTEDLRWHKCNIKTTSLLFQSMVRQKADEAGANDCLLIRNKIVIEASFSNFFIVDNDDKLITKKADNLILRGITRDRVINLAKKNMLEVEERDFGIDEVMSAKEAFLTSSVLLVRPVTKIDEKIIGCGSEGKITKKIRNLYLEFIERKALSINNLPH
jgi:D-alanine transaminase